MRDQILNFPGQLSKGVELAKGVKIDKPYDKVIVCGMGGSGIAGEILNFWQEISGTPTTFHIHRDYDLPAWASKNDLVVCVSWSGNTEETLSSYETAIKEGVPVASITTGSKLTELSDKHETPLVLIPNENLAPRIGAGYMTTALFQLLGLGNQISSITIDSENLESEGKKISEKIQTMTPLLYSSYKWRIIPKFWKILFNENAKIHAFWNYFPAMAHNELAGFTRQPTSDFYPIFFIDSGNDRRQNKNIDTAIAILNKREYNYNIVNISDSDETSTGSEISPQESGLKAVLNSYILGLWTTYYLAQKIGVDPENIELIEEYKKLKNKF